MPFLRVLRDKRGYETTYLMDWVREGTKQRSRLLYVFRTPANVRVGRTPLDRDMLLEIEARYPDIAFDWDSVREQQHVIEPAPPMRRRRSKREEGGDAAVPAPPPAASEPREQTPPPAAIPGTIEGSTPDEQIAFLTRWYPVVRDRIAARVTEPERRDALTVLAERLNPGAWIDADQIASGLQQASEALERLSLILVRRRRRSRRRPLPGERASPTGSPAAEAPPPEPPSSESEN